MRKVSEATVELVRGVRSCVQFRQRRNLVRECLHGKGDIASVNPKLRVVSCVCVCDQAANRKVGDLSASGPC
jgi:hypothetical protein